MLAGAVLLAAGCGSSKPAGTGTASSSHATSSSHGASVAGVSTAKARATTFAHLVNLVGRDVPGMRLLAPERERTTRTPSSEEVARCATGRVPQRIVLVRSAAFRSAPAAEGVVQTELERVSSSVEVKPSAAVAAHDIAAAHSARGRRCLARSLARLIEGSSRLAHAATSIAPLPFPLPGAPGSFGVRLAITATPPGGRPKHVYIDNFGFVVGPAEVSLTTTGAPRPVPTPTDRRLLALLYGRAKAHSL